MIPRSSVALALVLAACGGGGGPSPAPVPASESATADAVVRGFMQAVADSNVLKMAALWGNSHGSAAVTGQPKDYEKRMVITRAFLSGAKWSVTSDDPVEGYPDRRVVRVQLTRGDCVRVVPITAIKTDRGSWLVYQLDLNAAGNPARPCESAPEGP